MLRAWSTLPNDIALRIIGDGPLRDTVRRAASARINVVFDGPQDRHVVLDAMASARALVFPSEWYEGCPMTVIESFASGLPVIASRLGSLEEMVEDGRTGVLFEPANAEDLAEKVRWTNEHNDEAVRMADAARDEYEAEYTADRSYDRLLRIYRDSAG
jgi:glycosyltransferase involved in cell wall biosynthesis